MKVGANRANQEGLLRTVYLKSMRQQFNLRSILAQYVERNTADYDEGKELSLPLHHGQTSAIAWNSSGNLPTPGVQSVKRMTYNYDRLYGTIEIDGPHVEGASKSYAAEARPYQLETRNLVRQLRHGFSHDLFGDGDGSVGQPTTANGSTITLSDVRGVYDGMKVDILLAADGLTGAGGVTAASITVDPGNKQINLVAPATLADGGTDIAANPTLYKVYRGSSRNQAIWGLDAIISPTNPSKGFYGGIDRTAVGNEFWKGNLSSGGGVPRAASLALIDDMCSTIKKRTEAEPNLVLCGYEVYTTLIHELTRSKRWTGNQTKLNGWAEALMFNDIPIVRDKHCDPTKMYVLDTTTFKLYQNDEGKWMNQDGAILSRVEGRHAYRAAWFRFAQCVCDLPRGNGVIEDLDTAVPE